MRAIKETIVVEGKYDKNVLSQIVKANIVTTNGFGIFKDKKKQKYLKMLCNANDGIIIFTDPDGAGLVIRNFLKSILPQNKIFHAYVPEIIGKERRKTKPGKAGILGVEGMDKEIILKALSESGISFSESTPINNVPRLTKADLMQTEFTGANHSKKYRTLLLSELGLPENLSANALIDWLNLKYTREEAIQILKSKQTEYAAIAYEEK